MNVFQLRDQVVDQYSSYVRSFMNIRNPEIKSYVQTQLEGERLWPQPLVQLNPSFETGGSIDSLVEVGTLHPECSRIFRRRTAKSDANGSPLILHKHQRDAIDVAPNGGSYVLTTGTGSGKSLAYFVPIIDHVLKHGSGQGIRAIVVYPMNALCNSQYQALEGFLKWGYGEGNQPVTFARYTGQESSQEKELIATNPPDIILTNYVMLELLMTRHNLSDQQVVQGAEGRLEFLVLDELHTYRGRQGADVAMLVRRVRNRLSQGELRCVGTSATLATAGTYADQQREVAALASRIFGTDVPPESVIGESLRSAFGTWQPSPVELLEAVQRAPDATPRTVEAFKQDSIAWWTESAFGLDRDREPGRILRRKPTTLKKAAAKLSRETGASEDRCEEHLEAILLAGYGLEDPGTGQRLFAFRLHQFVSRGDTVYSALQPPTNESLSMMGQVFLPGSERQTRLYPLAFCRECGQHYFVIEKPEHRPLEARALSDLTTDDEDSFAGFVYLEDSTNTWDPDAIDGTFPVDWREERPDGSWRTKSSQRKKEPRRIYLRPDGTHSSEPTPNSIPGWWIPAPFPFCLSCGVTYVGRQGDFGKLAELATEGRSTATTVIALSIVQALRNTEAVDEKARKLLSFTDNRQDASLQAGHLNDFVQTTLLRGGLYRAVREAGPEGITHDVIARRVMEAIALAPEDYASNPEASYGAKANIDGALREVIGYHVFRDLKRGWRVNAPNLEQTGLLRVEYLYLDEICEDESLWRNAHHALRDASPTERRKACTMTLDFFRRSLAIKTEYLDPIKQESILANSNQHLIEPWKLDDQDQLETAAMVRIGPSAGRPKQPMVSFSARSRIGQAIRRASTLGKTIKTDEFDQLAEDLFRNLVTGGMIEAAGSLGARTEKVTGYRLQASAMRWTEGDGTVDPDPTRALRLEQAELPVNAFFRALYSTTALTLNGMEAREHTGQVKAEDRGEREDLFRDGKLPILFCSPTMELGVDIADLNAVNMRNVPPTPANYAQRSGRAGRSGQPALVLTYCSSMNPHDKWYFERPELMVSGQVTPPKLDLANEDLVKSHLYAIWLAETGVHLGRSIKEILDLTNTDDNLPITELKRYQLADPAARERALIRCRHVLLQSEAELNASRWYGNTWLDNTLNGVMKSFDEAFDRWRTLYRSARKQQKTQNNIMEGATASPDEYKQAERLRREAEAQIKLLQADERGQNGDFEPYRYLASAGFLPGYNFPRLPLNAYLPGRAGRGGTSDDFVARSRFIAISEFGPQNIVYHEGHQYQINRVIIPPSDGEEDSATLHGKLCPACGYGHMWAVEGTDRCVNCNTLLAGDHSFNNLFRMQNVSTRRISRITSDEEERRRFGYELRTAYRFGDTGNGLDVTNATYSRDGETLATAAYGPSTTIWRINLGWSRRKDKHTYGFMLDFEKGYWEQHTRDADSPEDLARHRRIIPFVEDRRNALVFELQGEAKTEFNDHLLSLQYALRRGIEAEYQVEQNEIGVELLPSDDAPDAILFYEAAEGGAGVLSQIATDHNALNRVAQQALLACHFNEDGDDDMANTASDHRCEAACYSCLLSYSNQRYHEELNRHEIRDLLLALAGVTGQAGTGPRSRSEQLDYLLGRSTSDLEKAFVEFLHDNGHVLPDDAQGTIEGLYVRPDFFYASGSVCIFVDGPLHEFPEQRAKDHDIDDRLTDAGYTVIRVTYPQNWPAEIAPFGWIFDKGYQA